MNEEYFSKRQKEKEKKGLKILRLLYLHVQRGNTSSKLAKWMIVAIKAAFFFKFLMHLKFQAT